MALIGGKGQPDLADEIMEKLRSVLSSFEAVSGNKARTIRCWMDGTRPQHTECVR